MRYPPQILPRRRIGPVSTGASVPALRHTHTCRDSHRRDHDHDRDDARESKTDPPQTEGVRHSCRPLEKCCSCWQSNSVAQLSFPTTIVCPYGRLTIQARPRGHTQTGISFKGRYSWLRASVTTRSRSTSASLMPVRARSAIRAAASGHKQTSRVLRMMPA
jgi:hypothetical protein